MPESRRSAGAGWLAPAEQTAVVRRLYADDLAQDGVVTNLSGVWAQLPGLQDRLLAGPRATRWPRRRCAGGTTPG